MRIESDQRKTGIIIVTMLAGFVLLVWMPGYFKVKSLNEDIKESQVQLGLNVSNDDGLQAMYQEVENLRQIISGVQQYVPQTDETSALMTEITRQMKQQQVSDQVTRTSEIEHGKDYSVIPMSLAFDGDFRAVNSVLSSIESMQRLIRVNKLTIDGDAESGGKPMGVRIELCSFSAPMGGE